MSSLGIFIALCVVGADLLLYFLFQWMYGEKRAAIAKKVAAQRQAIERERTDALRQQAGPFLVHSSAAGPLTQNRLRKIRERMGMRPLAERRSA